MASKRPYTVDELVTPTKRVNRTNKPYPTPDTSVATSTHGTNSVSALVSSTNVSLAPTPTTLKSGKDITVQDIVKHPNYVANITGTKWIQDTVYVKQLVSADGKPVSLLLFGTINTSQCGIYGDYSPAHQDSLSKANLKWTIRCPADHSSVFLEQVEHLQRLSNTIEKDFEHNGATMQRPVKNAAEFEMRNKLARKRRDPNIIVKPNDLREETHWQRCSKSGYEPNPLRIGVYDYFGHSKEFTEYESTLLPGTTVVI
ncbi:hypothetical protein HDV02_006250, partial [Globomyces sp. JEL0801]